MVKQKRLFTWKLVIEALVVLAILAVLYALSFFHFEQAQERAHVAVAQKEMQSVLRACVTFAADRYTIPAYRFWGWKIKDTTAAVSVVPEDFPSFLTTPIAYIERIPEIGSNFPTQAPWVRLAAISGMYEEWIYDWMVVLPGPYGVSPLSLPAPASPPGVVTIVSTFSAPSVMLPGACYQSSNGVQSLGILAEDTLGFSCGPRSAFFSIGLTTPASKIQFGAVFESFNYDFQVPLYPKFDFTEKPPEGVEWSLRMARMLGAKTVTDTEKLLARMESKTNVVRFEAAATVAALFPQHATRAVPILLEAITGNNPERRRTALAAFRETVDSQNKVSLSECIPVFLSQVKQATPQEREIFERVLIEAGLPGPQTIPLLQTMTASDDMWVRNYANWTLSQIKQ